MRRVRVNPAKGKDGEYLHTVDALFRPIKFKSEGNTITLTTYISRMIKAGDLVIVGTETKTNKTEPVKQADKKRSEK